MKCVNDCVCIHVLVVFKSFSGFVLSAQILYCPLRRLFVYTLMDEILYFRENSLCTEINLVCYLFLLHYMPLMVFKGIFVLSNKKLISGVVI